jgi:hypothetical protein
MAAATTIKGIPLPLFILPATHVLLLAAGGLVSLWSPYGLSPLFCVDLPISLPLVSRDDWGTVLVVGVLSTAWWYFVGRIGWMSRKHQLSRLGSTLGAALILFMCGVEVVLIRGQIQGWRNDERFSFSVIVVYAMAGALLAGGFVSGLVSAIAALQ